ncbi:uncharacterized protein EI90DRAFT_3293788 [Cantharellus anzutake]|uniref:uncharacterized protein n=1 Tax=Cantharellus anzutake TaxID=1750568 RepID=UPI001908EB58|nr:uncharacterized protein EI90DRAFT_3293788 [Cantharellus anzutake]KAF8315975.1 hypothetical protein EI90DRAFT_3293788 [Cantharellus anzutake]
MACMRKELFTVDALRSAESWVAENQRMAATIRELESRCGSQEDRYLAMHSEMCQELDSLRTAVPGSGGVDLPQMLDDIAQLRRQSSDAQTCLITGHLKVVKSLFDTDGNYRFKLRDVRQLLKEAQDEIEILSQDNNNNTSKPKCYTLINCIDNFLKETEVLKVVRDTLETATGELVEQKERTNQLEALNARNPENIQALLTAAKLDYADLTISDLRVQHSDLKAHNASLASDLTFLNARESETNSIIRSIVIAKDEIREKLAERNPAISQCHTNIARLTSQLEESQSKMEEYTVGNSSLRKLPLNSWYSSCDVLYKGQRYGRPEFARHNQELDYMLVRLVVDISKLDRDFAMGGIVRNVSCREEPQVWKLALKDKIVKPLTANRNLCYPRVTPVVEKLVHLLRA